MFNNLSPLSALKLNEYKAWSLFWAWRCCDVCDITIHLLNIHTHGAETVKLLLYIESLFNGMMVYTVSWKHGMPMTQVPSLQKCGNVYCIWYTLEERFVTTGMSVYIQGFLTLEMVSWNGYCIRGKNYDKVVDLRCLCHFSRASDVWMHSDGFVKE